MRHRTAIAAAALLLAGAASASGQTDYYNTDAGRPVRIEDATPVERFAFEGQIAPLRMERTDAGAYHWEVEPELAFGILPSTQIEAGLHLDLTDQEEVGRSLRAEGFEIAALHNLNVESRSLPALALAAEVLVPLSAESAWPVRPSAKVIATRTFRAVRVHVNGRYTFGPAEELDRPEEVLDHSRWMAGVAVDRAFVFTGALLIADVFVEAPLDGGHDLVWTAEAGARYQLDPFVALDIGLGRRMTGEARAWFVTLGAARTFGIPSIIPGIS